MSSVCAARSRSSTRSPASARSGCARLLAEDEWVPALGAMTGGQAVQMVKAGLKAIYLSGWQVAADANLSGNTYPDQSLYPANSAPGAREAHQQRAPAGRPDHACRRRRLRPLARADRGRRRGRVRRPAQRLRDHEVVHRGRRSGSPLRGSALLREEVRPPRRQGARSHRPAHPHARRGAACRGRLQRADADRRAHRRPLRLAADERHRRDRPRVLHRRAHAGRASSASATASTRRSPVVSPTRRTPT